MKTTKNQMTELVSFKCSKWMVDNLEQLAVKQLCNRGIIIRQVLNQYIEDQVDMEHDAAIKKQ